MEITKNNTFKFLIFILCLALLWFLGRFFHIKSDALEDTLRGFPLVLGALIFVVLYCLVTFFIWFSKDIFRLVAAVLFGPFLSTLFIWLAEIINTCILFSLARMLGRGFVEKLLFKKYSNFDQALAGINFFWLFVLRFVPLVPFRFLDLAVGLTKISFRKYISAVILGSPLRILWVQVVLAGVGKAVLDDPYVLMDYLAKNKAIFIFSWIYLVLVIIVALRLKFRKAKKTDGR